MYHRFPFHVHLVGSLYLLLPRLPCGPVDELRYLCRLYRCQYRQGGSERTSPDHVVTIGKSVDCSLQLSWDLNGNVAAVQAEIRQYVGSMRLIALENGVYVDNEKPLPIGKEVWLYHGRRFTIGNTSFTYVEKDN